MKTEPLEWAESAYVHPIGRVYPLLNINGNAGPSDDDWAKAYTAEGFFSLGTLEPEGDRTHFRMLADKARLYVRIECASRGTGEKKRPLEFYVTQAGKPDFPFIAVILNEDGEGTVGLARRAHGWWSNPQVSPLDETIIPRNVSVGQNSWTLEFSLPFDELNIPREGFRFNVVHDLRNGERFAWSDLGGKMCPSNQFAIYATAISAEKKGFPKNGLILPVQLKVGLNKLPVEKTNLDAQLHMGKEIVHPKDGAFEVAVRNRGPLDLRMTDKDGTLVETYHADVRRPFLINARERSVSVDAREFELEVFLDIAGHAPADILVSCHRGQGSAVTHKASMGSGCHTLSLPVPEGDGEHVRVSAQASVPLAQGTVPLILNALHWFTIGVDDSEIDAYREDIQSLPTDRLYYAILADAMTGLLHNQQGDGEYCRIERHDRWSRLWPQMCVYVPALLYKTKQVDNPWFGDQRLLDSAILGMEYALRPEIRMEEYGSPDSRSPQAFLLTYALLKDDIAPDRRAYWAGELEHIAQAEVDRALRSIVDKYTFYSIDCNTSTNHMSYHVANVYLAGEIFAREDWKNLGKKLMQRLARHGTQGYFEEQRGSPVNHYTWLTASALGEYYQFSGDTAVLPTLEACAHYMTAITTAQGHTMALHDSRNSQHHHYPVGDFVLSMYPEGRRAARARTFATMGDRPSCIRRETLFRLAENAIYFQPGEEADVFDSNSELPFPYGILVKKHGFHYGLSSVSRAAVHGNYVVDAQNIIEIFHKNAGCILHGGNSQAQPEAGNFFRALNEPDWDGKTASTSNDYLPHIATVIRMADGHQVRAEYRTFKANVIVQVFSPEQARVEVAAACDKGPVTFNFFPGVDEGEDINIDPDGRTLRFRQVTFRANMPFKTQTDFRMLNPYSMEYTYSHKPIRCWVDLTTDDRFILDIHLTSA